MTIITRETIDKINTLLDSGLVKGLGAPEPGKMCVEAAINYALGRPHGDDPGCVIEPLRRLKIRLNDALPWTSNKARAEGLRRLAIAQLGSKGAVDPGEFSKRVARMTIQTVLPGMLRGVAKRSTGEHPTKLLAVALRCEQDPSKANALEAKQVCHNAANAATYAAYAANAEASDAAAYAADASDAAAYADAYADASAAYAADAANAAAYATYAAYAANAATYAAYAADAANAEASAEQILTTFAENVVQILIEMKAPGTQWL